MNQAEFYSMIDEWISKPKSTWNHITLMAYFCHKYEKSNGVRFRLVRWKGSPGRGKESADFSKLMKLLLPENFSSLSKSNKKLEKEIVVVKIYNYINWMFDYKFRSGDKSVTGTKIFLLPSMINEFERMYSSYLKKKENKVTFQNIKSFILKNHQEILDDFDLDVLSDLQYIKEHCKSNDNYRDLNLLINKILGD